jgi:hypothetical protein
MFPEIFTDALRNSWVAAGGEASGLNDDLADTSFSDELQEIFDEIGDDQVCDNCAELLDDEYCSDNNIHILTKGDNEKTFCSECFNSLVSEMQKDGWTHDEQSDEEEQEEEDVNKD